MASQKPLKKSNILQVVVISLGNKTSCFSNVFRDPQASIDKHNDSHLPAMAAGGTVLFCETCELHSAVARHYRYMNTSCRGENNVASLLKSAQSIYFSPSFLSLSSSTPLPSTT